MGRQFSQLTDAEMQRIDVAMRANGMTATDVWCQIVAARRRVGGIPLSATAVYRYVRGLTHRRGSPERRGRQSMLSRRDIRKLMQV